MSRSTSPARTQIGSSTPANRGNVGSRSITSSPANRAQSGARTPHVSGTQTGRSAFQSQGSYQRPSQSQLSNFLDLPKSSGTQSHTFETQRGGTVTVGRGAGSTTTPRGAQVGGAGSAIKVETAGGNTVVRGRGAVGATDGQNSVVRAGAGAAVQDRSGNVRAGAVGASARTDGNTTVRSAGSVRAARGPGGNTAVAGRRVTTVNGRVVSAQQVYGVRRGFAGYGFYYTPAYYRRYPGAWVAAGIVATAWWAGTTWDSSGNYCGCEGDPVSYDYGEDIYYQDNTVYYGDRAVATSDQYYQETNDLAAAGAETDNEDWMPLGVFAIVNEDQTKTDKVIQLAVNKDGVVRGNLNDQVLDQVVPLEGSVDRKTQRVAFRPKDKPNVVAEAGLWNLTQDSLSIMIHFDGERVEERALIRLQEPEQGS